MLASLGTTYTLYATLYVLPWLRLLGARIGKRAEISTVSHFDPDLLTLDRRASWPTLPPSARLGITRYGRTGADRTRRSMFRRQRRPGPVRPSTQRRQLDRRSLGSAGKAGRGGHLLARLAGDLPAAPPGKSQVRGSPYLLSPRPAGCVSPGHRVLSRVLPPTFLFAFLILLTASCVRLAEFLPAEQPWLLAAVLPGIYLVGAVLLTGW